jgi:2-oxoglutarate ferredoxin oxidoreductase subunit beta
MGFSLERGSSEGAVVHDETRDSLALAMALASLEPPYPQPVGVLRAVERPTVDGMARAQEELAAAMPGPKDLEALLSSGDTWNVSGET